jgi:SAM-dependent methyltransferase
MADDYEKRLASQQDQYLTGQDIHALPEIFHYWSNKYLRPKLEEVFNVWSVCDFYAYPFSELFGSNRRPFTFVSIGSGDGLYEIQVCQKLIELGHTDFQFIGLEVNDSLIREGAERIRRHKLNHCIEIRHFDLNRDALDFPVHGFMAHHSLHHMVELERLFSMIDHCLVPDGRFVTSDMVGRNGHMRWPETLTFIEALWHVVADNKKYNHLLKQKHCEFLNFDCSVQGFEGIRSQDIMPLLTSRFSFNAFFGAGGLIEIFVDRGYGPNFDPRNPQDLRFIDLVEYMNAELIELGLIKPTMIFADMSKKSRNARPRIVGHLTPEFCTRVPT